ncbi:hypothetical protein DN546_32175 [Burkholderia multivorans]|uniref:hypothetical protein n=1 Tax=Burkholderia multivorans TaxID=87883 RepID=UPI000DACDDE9|nr:hypothetical protein [Burkholderia multivorans]RAA22200.1 hypothetical protein DN465_31385 [Burkholderia multivorans]RAA70659.1 hypothetical protein DN468_31175 [Burkholderia multivorans]RAE58066.1 hypothetical protein DN473_31120 [Burkholderia multivorans]RAE75770.1 hypothetical protein DN540_31435 [Burkholderia multivorans]RAF25874.1 hypothetical protein DN545_30990 [Burkholderia multivorans]
MWILGIIAASIATALLIMLLKGGIRLVGAVVSTVLRSVIDAFFLALSGVTFAVIWLFSTLVKIILMGYRKFTTRETDVDEFTTYSWMKDSELRDE